MRVLVVGFGSIGGRHARLLAGLGHEVACLTRNPDCPHPVFASAEAAQEAFRPEAAVVATATADHQSALESLARAGFRGRVLVEKPLFHRADLEIPAGPGPVFVGYNLRFHPLVPRLRELLRDRRILSIQAYVGQHLSLWRPGRDFRQCYSAHRDQGGGVLRDLSHELDLVQLLAGPWSRVAAVLGTFGDLGIESEDTACLLLEAAGCPAATIQLNYLDPKARRELLVLAQGLSLKADFVAGTLETPEGVERFAAERDTTYLAQARAFVGDCAGLCTLGEAGQTVALIDAAEQAARNGRWVRA